METATPLQGNIWRRDGENSIKYSSPSVRRRRGTEASFPLPERKNKSPYHPTLSTHCPFSFLCNICNFECSPEGNLNRHMKIERIEHRPAARHRGNDVLLWREKKQISPSFDPLKTSLFHLDLRLFFIFEIKTKVGEFSAIA